MDPDLMVAEADPARHAYLAGPDSPGAARLYREITVPGPRGRGLRRPALAVVAGLVAAGAAAALVITGLPAGPGSGGPDGGGEIRRQKGPPQS